MTSVPTTSPAVRDGSPLPVPRRRRVPGAASSRRPPRSAPAAPTTTPTGPAASRPGCARVVLARGRAAAGGRGAGRARAARASTASTASSGPVIFAANHHSHVDTAAAAHLDPRAVAPPGRSSAPPPTTSSRNRVTAAASALVLNAIPIERTKVTRRSADQAAELIDDGWSMLIFPEGGRSPDGWGQPFRGGAAYLAHPLRRARRARAHRGHRPHPAQGRQAPAPGRPPASPSATPLLADDGEDSRALRGPHRARRSRRWPTRPRTDWYSARRAGPRRRDAVAAGPERRRRGAAPGPSATGARSAAAHSNGAGRISADRSVRRGWGEDLVPVDLLVQRVRATARRRTVASSTRGTRGWRC